MDRGDVEFGRQAGVQAQRFDAVAHHFVQARLGAQQQPAIAGFVQHAGARVAQPVIGAEDAQFAPCEAVQALRGAEPQGAAVVAQDAVDLRAAHRRQFGRKFEPVAAQRRHAAARTDPHRAVFRQQRVGAGMRQFAARHHLFEAITAQHAQPAVRADPELAVAAARHRPQHPVGQAFMAAITPGPAVPEPAQAFPLASEPEIALAVLEHRTHRRGGEVVGDHFLHAAGAQTREMFDHADPEIAVAVFGHRLDRSPRQGLAAFVAQPLVALAVEQAGTGAGPQPALGRRELGDHGIGILRGQGQQLDHAAGDAEDPAQAADPEFVAPGEQRGGRAGQGIGKLEDVVADPVDAVGCGHHQLARRQRDDVLGVDGTQRVATGDGDGAETVLIPHRQATIGGDPEPVLRVHVQVVDPDAAQARRVLGVVGGEADAVETREPRLGADPQVTLAVLGDGHRADLRQALLDAPGVADVVVEGLVRVERRRRTGHAQCECETCSQRQGAAQGGHEGGPEDAGWP